MASGGASPLPENREKDDDEEEEELQRLREQQEMMARMRMHAAPPPPPPLRAPASPPLPPVEASTTMPSSLAATAALVATAPTSEAAPALPSSLSPSQLADSSPADLFASAISATAATAATAMPAMDDAASSPTDLFASDPFSALASAPATDPFSSLALHGESAAAHTRPDTHNHALFDADPAAAGGSAAAERTSSAEGDSSDLRDSSVDEPLNVPWTESAEDQVFGGHSFASAEARAQISDSTRATMAPEAGASTRGCEPFVDDEPLRAAAAAGIVTDEPSSVLLTAEGKEDPALDEADSLAFRDDPFSALVAQSSVPFSSAPESGAGTACFGTVPQLPAAADALACDATDPASFADSGVSGRAALVSDTFTQLADPLVAVSSHMPPGPKRAPAATSSPLHSKVPPPPPPLSHQPLLPPPPPRPLPSLSHASGGQATESGHVSGIAGSPLHELHSQRERREAEAAELSEMENKVVDADEKLADVREEIREEAALLARQRVRRRQLMDVIDSIVTEAEVLRTRLVRLEEGEGFAARNTTQPPTSAGLSPEGWQFTPVSQIANGLGATSNGASASVPAGLFKTSNYAPLVPDPPA